MILLPVMRNVMSMLRSSPVGGYVDDHVGFHMLCASVIAVAMLLHITCHCVHMHQVITADEYYSTYEELGEPGPVRHRNYSQRYAGMHIAEYIFNPENRFAGFTGILLTFLYTSMMVTALPCMRAGRGGPGCMGWSAVGLVFLGFLGLGVLGLLWRVTVFIAVSVIITQAMCCGAFCFVVGKFFKRVTGFHGFQNFQRVHELWKPAYLILLLHAPQVWVWLLWPALLVALDRAISKPNQERHVDLLSAQVLARSVLKLRFRIPDQFRYTAGQYIRLRCDNINEEWHPFTISSAPEDDFIQLNIRCDDSLDWCSELRKLLVPIKAAWRAKPVHPAVEYSQRLSKFGHVENIPNLNGLSVDAPPDVQRYAQDMSRLESGVLAKVEPLEPEEPGDAEKTGLTQKEGIFGEMIVGEKGEVPIHLRIDGPFGAPAEAVWSFRTVMLVGAGIGVTPFASIIRSWSLQRDAKEKTKVGKNMKVEQLNFYWICRSQEEWHWFIDVLTALLKKDGSGNVKALPGFHFSVFATGEITLAEVEKSGFGAILPKENIVFGRPNWRRIYKEVKDQHDKEHIGVFLCGPPPVRVQLEEAAQQFSDPKFPQAGTKFSVHAESF